MLGVLRLIFFAFVFVSPHGWAGPLTVESAWVRAMPPQSANSAGYLRLSNTSDRPVKVVDVHSSIAARVEIHTSTRDQAGWKMRALEHLILVPGQEIELAPGGVHLMIFDLRESLSEGQSVDFTLELEDVPAQHFTAKVQRSANEAEHADH